MSVQATKETIDQPNFLQWWQIHGLLQYIFGFLHGVLREQRFCYPL